MSTEDNNGAVDDESSKVRTRVSRACTRCRSRKDKCDGLRPSCSTCVNASVAHLCGYVPSHKKRGLPEGYVRGLEKLMALLVGKIDGLEAAAVQILRDDRESLVHVWNHRLAGEELHTTWKECGILPELEALLASLDHGQKRKREREESPAATLADSDVTLDSMLSTRYSVDFTPLASSSIKPHNVNNEQLVGPQEVFKLPAGASDLLNDYFQSIHCWLPILDRPHMLKKCYELARQEVPVNDSNADLARLAASLALVLQQSPPSYATSTVSGDFLHEMSKKCVPFLGGTYTTGHVQALILLVLADISGHRWSQAWVTVGLAARILLNGVQGTILSRQEIASLQACFILDTLVALRLSRLPQLRRSHITSLLLEDGHEEWEPLALGPSIGGSTEPGFVISTFNRLTETFGILNDCLCSLGSRQHLEDLTQLSQTYPFPLSNTSDLPPNQTALKAVYFAITAYVELKTSENRAGALRNITTASNLYPNSYTMTTLPIVTTLIEAVRQEVSDLEMAVPPNKRQRNEYQSTNAFSLWPADPFAQPLPPPNQELPEPAPSGYSTADGFSSNLPMDLDILPSARHKSATIYNPSIATSPSFQGDEIDALFHEMAQLDTTEWADGRTQALKDFGFSDDLTFEAFCNDPDRVFSGSSMAPQTVPNASSSVGFGMPLPTHNSTGTAFESFNVMGQSWNG